MENLRLVTGHAMLHHLDIHVVDVKNVFLQAEMKEKEWLMFKKLIDLGIPTEEDYPYS